MKSLTHNIILLKLIIFLLITNTGFSQTIERAKNNDTSFDFNVKKGGEWLMWDTGVMTDSVGFDTKGWWTSAVYWDTEDFCGCLLYCFHDITIIKVGVWDLPEGDVVARIWQGPDRDNLIECAFESFTPVPYSINELMLTVPCAIDPNYEYWLGIEWYDPGEGFYPAGIDTEIEETPDNGKGEMIMMGRYSEEKDWTTLSEIFPDLKGVWNHQIFIEQEIGTLNPTITFSVTDASDYSPLTDVTVDVINVFNDSLTKTTNINGLTYFSHCCFQGLLDYKVSLDDYKTVTGEIELSGDTLVEIKMEKITNIVKEENHIKVSVFPNPASEKFIVESNQKIKQIKLININGKIAAKYAIDAFSTEININELKQGVYFMKIISDKSVKTKRVLVVD